MRAIVRLLFGRYLDRMADEAIGEFRRLSHCHVCGRCLCNWHSAFSDDDWDEQRRICQGCLRRRERAA